MQPPHGQIVGLGEILWDELPAGRQLGGAPSNFAFHCHQLGHPAAVVSRVGADEPGQALRGAVRRLGLPDAWLQEDRDHPTGRVTVAVDERGQPSYTIHADAAYDHLAWDGPLEALFGTAQAVCFGTLIQRHPVARATVRRALGAARNTLVIFDVNLRQDFWGREVIEESLRASRWAKLNEDELTVLRDLLALGGASTSQTLAALRRRYGLELAAVTRGERGCLVQTDDEEIAVPGVSVVVADTVGAGDAFTAGLLACVLEGRSLDDAAGFANRLAARVAASPGATPVIDRRDLER
jgi:fructokinase